MIFAIRILISAIGADLDIATDYERALQRFCAAWLQLLQINSVPTVSLETMCLMKQRAVSVLVSQQIGAVSPVSQRFLGVKWRRFCRPAAEVRQLTALLGDHLAIIRMRG
jgi:hypothetical protein